MEQVISIIDDSVKQVSPKIMKEDIKLFGYNVKIETVEEKSQEDDANSNGEESLHIRISYKKSANKPEFMDEFIVSHKNRDFLSEVVNTIRACFGKEAIQSDFIKYNTAINCFEFSFESKTNRLTTIRTCCLSRAKYYTKQEAIQKIKDSNYEITKNGGILSVECINAHHIHDPQWELEVTLNVS
eukprot:328468_1